MATTTRRRGRFHDLTITSVRHLTDDSIEVTFAVPDELVDDAAIVGDVDHVRQQIKLWEAAGVTMMVIGARSPEQIAELATLL